MVHPRQFNQLAGAQGNGGQGLPSQDLINTLYDIFGGYPRLNVLPYHYAFQLTTAEGTAIPANGTARASIKITADASFIATYVNGSSDGEYTIFYRMDASDRQLMNIPIHAATGVGTAERPFIFPKPLLIEANTTISFDLQDLSGQENEVYLTLCGFKVYQRQYAMAG